MDAAHQDVRFTPANETQHRRNYSLPDAPWAWPKIQAWCASHRMPQSAAVIYGFMRHVESAVVNDRLPYEHLSVGKLATLGFADKSPRRLRLYRQCLTDIGLWHVPKRGTIVLTDLEKRSTRNGQNTYWLFANIRQRTRDADNARKKLARRQQAAPFIAGRQLGRAQALTGVAKPHTPRPPDVESAKLNAIANTPASGHIQPLAFLKDAEFGTKAAVYCQSTKTSASYNHDHEICINNNDHNAERAGPRPDATPPKLTVCSPMAPPTHEPSGFDFDQALSAEAKAEASRRSALEDAREEALAAKPKPIRQANPQNAVTAKIGPNTPGYPPLKDARWQQFEGNHKLLDEKTFWTMVRLDARLGGQHGLLWASVKTLSPTIAFFALTLGQTAMFPGGRIKTTRARFVMGALKTKMRQHANGGLRS